MFKAYCLFLLVCCFNVSKGNSRPPEGVWAEGNRLYNKLNLENIISFPAFYEALKGYYALETQNPILTLIDFTKPSTEKRFCVIDLKQRRILFKSYVAHGKNSGENYAVSFSNQPGSYKSSLGLFRTGETYFGKNGYSLILEGLEKNKNDMARKRAIVIHGADYADPIMIPKQGRLGRSQGCPALPPAVSDKIINAIKQGTLLYIHG